MYRAIYLLCFCCMMYISCSPFSCIQVFLLVLYHKHFVSSCTFTVFHGIDRARTIYFSALIGAWTNRGARSIIVIEHA